VHDVRVKNADHTQFIIPYFIYWLLVFLSPKPFQEWLGEVFPGLAFEVFDPKKIILPFALLVISHYLLSDWRKKLNEPFFNRINDHILKKIRAETNRQEVKWGDVRPAFYHVIDGDKSLTYLSERIKHNGLVWFGFTDLRLASILMGMAWLVGGLGGVDKIY